MRHTNDTVDALRKITSCIGDISTKQRTCAIMATYATDAEQVDYHARHALERSRAFVADLTKHLDALEAALKEGGEQ